MIEVDQRRYDLDWIRVFAFFLLILFHVGMFYSPWGWHAKSPQAPVGWMELPMVLMSSWRLWLLFFILGAALCFAMTRSSRDRFWPGAFPACLYPSCSACW
ncbi:MAG: hypothetical protein GKR94_34245 [Gammaproteobacteria bacterium]|nr:hypothetical protein [Gammaproteobacteria bacterium]